MSNDSFINSLIIAKAATLARKGMLSKAEELLAPLVEADPDSIEAAHLLAKIHAQQGSFQEAKGLWTRILEQNPYHTDAAKALERCARFRERRQRPHVNYLVHLSLVTVIAVIAVFLKIQPPSEGGEWMISSFTALGASSEKTAAADEAAGLSRTPAPSSASSWTGNKTQEGERKRTPAGPSWIDKILTSMPFYKDTSPMAGLIRTERTEKIEKALWANSLFRGTDLQVGEDRGSIFVVGAVPTWPIRRRVEQFVRENAGKVYVDVNKVILTGVYVVQPGDSLNGIAEKLYGNASYSKKIMEINHLPAADAIREGQKLTLPGTGIPATRR
ncbi:MAG TPA: LysM peptidoglycan-binding domain-containing protein [bacterium]|nr:LysM peptidoglycan-binding domain-containing protein [bacterium]